MSILIKLSNFTPEFWAAIIAAFVAIWSIWQNTLEWKRARFLQGINMLFEKEKEFNSSEFRKVRAATSKYLLNPNIDVRKPPPEFSELLNFFEAIAYLNSKKLIDDMAIWHSFSSWIFPYLDASKGVIAQEVLNDSNYYSDIRNLFDRLKKIESTKHSSRSYLHAVESQRIKEILSAEEELA